MNKLTTIFKLDVNDFEAIQSLYSCNEFSISIFCVDIGEGIELDFNSASLNSNIFALNDKLNMIDDQVLSDDYISLTIYNSADEKIFKHENKRFKYNTESIMQILSQPDIYPNYLDEKTVPWWENEE